MEYQNNRDYVGFRVFSGGGANRILATYSSGKGGGKKAPQSMALPIEMAAHCLPFADGNKYARETS